MSNRTPDDAWRPASVHVLGAGAWGTTLALLADRAGTPVTLVARDEVSAAFLDRERRHPRSLPGVVIPPAVRIEHLGAHSLDASDAVVVAMPVQALRDALTPLGQVLAGVPILSAAKGLEVSSLSRPSEIIADVVAGDASPIAVLSGPNLSGEIAAGKPASTVVASVDPGVARGFAAVFHSDRFRVYLGSDLAGVEFGGSLKNIVAIGAGIADGLDAGDNAKAAFVTRGLAEIARLGVACGAEPLTFAGLSGMGDLIATCASPLSRNHQVGVALAQGRSLAEIQATMTETAEGVATTRAAVQLGDRLGVELPIALQMHRVLFEGVEPAAAIASLMAREPGPEWMVPVD